MASTVFDTYSPRATPEPMEIPQVGKKTEIPEYPEIPQWKYKPTTVKFDPSVHLNLEKPTWRKQLSDFGYDNNEGVCDLAATAPFQLFSDEAVRLMRNDLLSEVVQENHVYMSERSPYIVRGFARSKSPFVYDAWHSKEVLDAISEAAGIELVPVMDYEIASTNIQLGSKGPAGVRELGELPSPPKEESDILPSIYDSKPVDDWHYDGVPIVAVLMVSDTTGMVGGETAVRCKDGTVGVVPGPAKGKVVLMQGSVLHHAALRSLNCNERIAMVTSLRPKDPNLYDMSHLANVCHTSDQKDLGLQWLVYRLEVLEARLRYQRERLLETEDFTQAGVKEFADIQREYLDKTANEITRLTSIP